MPSATMSGRDLESRSSRARAATPSRPRRAWAAVAVVLLSAAACSEREYGTGIGRPPATPSERTETLPITISAVYAAAPVSEQFVELHAVTATPIDLSQLSLCSGTGGCIELSGTLAGTAYHVLGEQPPDDLEPLGLFGSVGELAVIGEGPSGQPVVEAYVAWGADPGALPSSFHGGAVVSGVTEPGSFVELPFPLPAGVAIANDGELRGCTDPAGTHATGVDKELAPALCAPGPAPVRMIEVFPAAVEGGDSWVELQNLLDEPVQLYGLRICRPESCAVLGEIEIAASWILRVHLGISDPGDGRADEVYLPGAPPIERRGELGLFAPGAARLDDPERMLSFVRTGSTPGTFSQTAVAAGIWPSLDTLVRSPSPGESVVLATGSGASPDDWQTGCGVPVDAAEPSDLVIAAIHRGEPAGIVVRNRGQDAFDPPVDGDPWSLMLGDASFDLAGLDSLAPEAEVTIRVPGSCNAAEPCWDDPAATIDASGAASITVNGIPVDFVRWGLDPSPLTAAAVDAGVWPDEFCRARGLGPGDSLHLRDGASGQSPRDYD